MGSFDIHIMKVLTILASVLLVAAGQNSFSLNVPGIDAWRLALDQHAAAEGRLSGFVPGAPSPQVAVPTHISNGNFQGIPQWQLNQQAVLVAEKKLEVLQTTTQPPPPPPTSEVIKNTKVVENFISQLKTDQTGVKTSGIAKLLEDVKNRSKAGAAVREDVASAEIAAAAAPSGDSDSASARSPTFLDSLLDTLIAGEPAEPDDETLTNEVEDNQEDDDDSISEILRLLGKKEKKRKPVAVVKKAEDDNGLADILALIAGGPTPPKTKPSRAQQPSLAELLGLSAEAVPSRKTSIIHREDDKKDAVEAEAELLAESLVAQLLGGSGGSAQKAEAASPAEDSELDREINAFLAILGEIDPSLSAGGAARPAAAAAEKERSSRVVEQAGSGGGRVSNFIQEELTEAAEESVLLSTELDELLAELEEEKKKDLKFVEETFQTINTKLRNGADLQTILKDDAFVDSVFHRFAILGFPLRKEDLSIKDLMEAKVLVTQNILAAAEQNKRIALDIIQELDQKSRRIRRSV